MKDIKKNSCYVVSLIMLYVIAASLEASSISIQSSLILLLFPMTISVVAYYKYGDVDGI